MQEKRPARPPVPTKDQQRYLKAAENLVKEWVQCKYPQSVSEHGRYDDDPPTGILLCRPTTSSDGQYPGEKKCHGQDGGSLTLIPEVHFWHEDEDLTIVRGRPSQYEILTHQGPGSPPTDQQRERCERTIKQWTDELPCCRYFEVQGHHLKVYAHNHPGEEDWPYNPALYPQIFLSGEKDNWTTVIFRPVKYELTYLGTWTPQENNEERRTQA